MQTYSFTGSIFRWKGESAWHFITVPADTSDDIADAALGLARGFGSVRVEVTIGTSTWRTSLFPDSKAGAYVLPVKKAIRIAENLDDGVETAVRVTLLDPPGSAPDRADRP